MTNFPGPVSPLHIPLSGRGKLAYIVGSALAGLATGATLLGFAGLIKVGLDAIGYGPVVFLVLAAFTLLFGAAGWRR